MRQIKTVIRSVDKVDEFDCEVNKLLCRGWKMKRRETILLPEAPNEAFNVATFPMLYAELERRV